MSNLKDTMLSSLKTHAEGNKNMHISNVKIYLENPVGIGEHPQHLDEIDKLFQKIADAQEKLKVIEDFRGERSAL